ncbi:MAG: methyltransferase domain-containing protein [bacterium]|nr:methyltransferase domain-containing protein [bacterium]
MSEKSQSFIDNAMTKIGAGGGIVLDVGGGERFTKWLARYKRELEHCDYKTFDYDASTGADIVGDIHKMPIADGYCDAIICSSVLEHVRDPLTAMSELRRILKKGGLIFLYVPSIYPYHARKGHYPDYWRFFDDTMREILFAGFSEVTVHKRGGYFLALSFFVPLQHKLRWLLNPLAQALDALFATHKRNTTAGYYMLAVK